MVEAAQVRAARALIGWSQAKLAETAGLPVSTINAFETGAPTKSASRSRPPAPSSSPRMAAGA
jgi:DNA-binding XRE family transcriptional regulator